MKRAAVLGVVLAGLASASAARAQTFAARQEGSGIDILEQQNRFKTEQRFAFELRFGPYKPDVDGEFNGARTPYADYYGNGAHLITQMELDYEIFHRFGTIAAGIGLGYFSVSANSPVANGTGLPSGDQSTFKVIPLSASAVYRFDYFLEMRKIPLVPFAKAGLDWAYWQITDGNDEIATDGQGGHGRGGTLGYHAALGVAFVLDFLDPEAARDFDSDLGVNHTSIVFQYTYANISGLGMSDRLHVGDNNWSLGLMFQF